MTAPAVDRVRDGVRAGGLLAPGVPVLAMVSGGRDSVCLLDVAVAVAGVGAVTALHVNYGLRDGSDGDEALCREHCEALGVPLRLDRPGPPPDTGNLHGWARDRRYGAALRVAPGDEVAIATGHTATDQAETVLYRLAASPGRRALLGMRPRDGRLVRPLLERTREETAAYCEARGLRWREDPSNDSDAFARARVRNEVMPALRGLHPAAEANVVRTAALLRDEAEVLDALVTDVLGDRRGVELDRLRGLAPALRRLVVRRLAEDAAGRLAPDAAARAEEIVALGERARRSAALDLEGGLRALWQGGELSFQIHLAGPDGNGTVEAT